MPVSQGNYSIGKVVGADYGSIASAVADVALPLTGNLTFEFVSSTNDTTQPPQIVGDLGGYTLRFTSAMPHTGRPNGGFVASADIQGLRFLVHNGKIEIDNLQLEGTSSGWCRMVEVAITAGGDSEFSMHDLLITSSPGSSMTDSSGISEAILISGGGDPEDHVTYKIWNVIVNALADNIGGLHTSNAIRIDTTAGRPNISVTIENSVFRVYGSNPGMLAINVDNPDGVFRFINVAAISDSSGLSPSEVGFAFTNVATAVQLHCAATDASAGIAAVSDSPYNNMVVVDEFVSVDNGAYGTFFVPTVTGLIKDYGTTPTIEQNTQGIQNERRPHGQYYSVGAVEGVKPRISSGTHTVGVDGEYPNMASAFAAIDTPLTGDLTLDIISDVRDINWIWIDPVWTTLDLATNKLRITSSTPHNGDPRGGVTWTLAVYANGIMSEFYFDDGDFEIDNIIIKYESSIQYIGQYIELGTSGNIIPHDLLIFGDDDNLAVGGIHLWPWNGAGLRMWNVIVDVEHVLDPQLGLLIIDETYTAKINIDPTGMALVENCTFYGHCPEPTGPPPWIIPIHDVVALMLLCDTSPEIVVRNVLSMIVCDVDLDSYAFFSGPKLMGIVAATGYNCASNDGSAVFDLGSGSFLNVDISSLVTRSKLSGQFFSVPKADSVLGNGATPQIAENDHDIRGNLRGGTGIGVSEPLPPHTGDSPFVTNFQVIPVIEGPQILSLWSLPNDSDSTDFKLLKKLLGYSETETDGTTLIDSPVSTAPVSYVDLNPDIQRVWCYTAFVYHYCQTYWQAGVLVEIDRTVVPITTTGFFYVSRTRGVTGLTEPTWPTEVGATVVDGDVVWECFAINPSWVTSRRSRGAGFTWDSEYMQRLPFRTVSNTYRNEDAKSSQLILSIQQDPGYFDVWRAIHEDGNTKRGEFERFLLIFGTALSRIKGAIDFYPKLVDPDECLPQYLPQLAGIVGWELSTDTPVARQRQEIISAVPVYKSKGTEGSLEPLLRAATGVQNVIVDPMSHHVLMSNRLNRRSARGCTAASYSSWLPLVVTARGDIVIPTTFNRTGYYYQARQAGTTAASEPVTWPTIPGDDVTDGTVIWRCRQYGQPHITADAGIGATSLSVDDTSELEVGRTINIRDDTTPEGEEAIVASIPSSTSITLEEGLANAYLVQNNAILTPAFDWYDDQTGFIWDRPLIETFDGIDPDRVRVPGDLIEPSILYSFEFIRLWFLLEGSEEVSIVELERIATIMGQFAPADTDYVVRIEEA